MGHAGPIDARPKPAFVRPLRQLEVPFRPGQDVGGDGGEI